ncbi:NUDIX hydrolase [Brachybacterium halotolerans subsp. kimchii]|uniref:NUDIX domain-containing protein n=1 Tax=Brachybacterium halotolerans TaxID=2795215 RepID=UPI001E2EF4CC|nr:NUDIX hydrolase [Brachybacterium halotolerans]UEJ84437.1 NUDIX hydrolase [Brachybacterium halotolerans subsp. kimchii]
MNELLPDAVYFDSLPKVITSGAVILRDEHDRVLIEKPNYRDHWLLPGGGVDPGEDARACAHREVREELGLDLPIGRLLAVHWMPSRARVGAPMGAHFLFDAGVVPAARLEADVVPQAAELDDWMLADADELDLLGPWGASRARRGLAVLRGDSEVDLLTP